MVTVDSMVTVNSMVTVKVVVGSRGLWSMSRLDSIQDSRLLHRIVSLLLGSRVLLFLHVYWLSWKCYHGCELRCRCTHQWSTFPSILLGRTLSPCQQTPSPCQQTIGTTGRQEETRNWRANYPVVIITWRKFAIFQNFKVKKLLLDRVYCYYYWSRTISILRELSEYGTKSFRGGF